MQITNTRKQIFYPYKYINHGLDITITELKIDGNNNSDIIDKTNKKINLIAKEFQLINIGIKVNTEIEILNSVFIEGERVNPPCDTFLILHCDETKYRRAIKLTKELNEQWVGNIELEKKDFNKSIQFFVLTIRNTDRAEENNGYAKNFGEKLLSSHEWIIQIDEPSTFPGNFLSIEWENFRNSTLPFLSKNPDLLFYLDFGEQPKLILNESIENLKNILSNEGRTGIIPTIRDIIFDSITQQVWTSLILASCQSVEEYDDLNSWQLSVLKQFAPSIYSDSDEQNAIEELIKESHSNSDITNFIPKINVAIQNKIKIDRSVKNLLNLSLKENG